MLAILDEECIRPGDRSDEVWLSKLDDKFNKHSHYSSRHAKGGKKVASDVFVLTHYAGEVRDSQVEERSKGEGARKESKREQSCLLNFCTSRT